MTDDPIEIDVFADQFSVDSPGPADYERLMEFLTLVVELVASDLPPVGLSGLDAARQRWVERHGEGSLLLERRVACWQYLDAKNGNSTTIADREDHAVRAVIGLLFEWPEVAPYESLYETAAFALEMVEFLGVRGSAVKAILERP